MHNRSLKLRPTSSINQVEQEQTEANQRLNQNLIVVLPKGINRPSNRLRRPTYSVLFTFKFMREIKKRSLPVCKSV